ncbi:MAG: rhomboid family intramembrane serine protease [Eubacterium sp.]|nr:rhomboid family intramembrane serine protease [Eubacterium sp.]
MNYNDFDQYETQKTDIDYEYYGMPEKEQEQPLVRKGITLTKILIAFSVIVYAVTEIMGDTESAEFMHSCGALWTEDVLNGEYWRLVTPIFLHFGPEHLFGNVVLWYFMGDVLERAIGKLNYFILFILSGVAGNVLTVLWEIHTGEYAVSAGASGAVFGILGALLLLVIINKGHFEYMSLKRMLFFIVFSLIVGYESAGVNYIAHAGGLAAGFVLAFPMEKIYTKLG